MAFNGMVAFSAQLLILGNVHPRSKCSIMTELKPPGGTVVLPVKNIRNCDSDVLYRRLEVLPLNFSRAGCQSAIYIFEKRLKPIARWSSQ